MDNRTFNVLRYMAWERAKGELNSMLTTFYGEQNNYITLKKAIDDFIKDIEDNGKHD